MTQQESGSNRRPIQSRQWKSFHAIADCLARIGVTPNAISVSSVFFAGVAGLLLAGTRWQADGIWLRLCWLGAALLIQLRLIANLLDGLVAIEANKKSAVGDLYNEVPDRIADSIILIAAGYAVGGSPAVGMLAAVVAVFVAYVRVMGASVGVGQVFAGPMAKPQRMAIMTLACVYCAATPQAWQPRWQNWGIIAAALALILAGALVTGVRRLMRIGDLMRQQTGEAE